MNIVVFCHDLPYPQNHGGRIDTYNRIKAFKELGHRVFFIGWAHKQTSNNITEFRSLVDDLVCLRKRKNVLSRAIDLINKAIRLAAQPNLVSHCSVSKRIFQDVHQKISVFQPDIYFVENVYVAKLAYKFARKTKLPVFIRSHNIEHIYIKTQANLSKTLMGKFKFYAMAANLKRYEIAMLRKATAFFDISLSDLEYWIQSGLSNGYWMPTVYYDKSRQTQQRLANCYEFDIAYIGNLNTPNNVQGVIWFLRNVYPIITERNPNVRILIAGSNPIKNLCSLCSTMKNVRLLPNPEDIALLYHKSKILVNPIFFGSGVNIKSVEMLHLLNPVVCTPKALNGLPDDLKRFVEIAECADEFAFKILSLLNKDSHHVRREEALKFFSPEYMLANIQIMKGFQVKHC